MNTPTLRLETDYVVVGSGAGGGVAAWALACAGFKVVVLEEGPAIDRKLSAQSAGETLLRYFRECGTQVAEGRTILPVLQGRCLGGGTAINSAICWRLPEDAWARVFGEVADMLPLSALHAAWDELEPLISVRPVGDAIMGRNNQLLRQGATRLGWAGHPTLRNEAGCDGSGLCIQACPSERKRSTDLTFLPWAQEKGAEIRPGWEVVRVRPRTASSMAMALARATRDGGQEGCLEVRARRGILLAASAVQTPVILQRSRLGNQHVGRHFMAHPGAAMVGIFDEPVKLWQGATQGYEVDHFRQRGRFKIETLALPLELGAARIPGVGPRFLKGLGDWGHIAYWGCQFRANAEGTVRPRILFSGAAVHYSPLEADMYLAREGLLAMARLMEAAGARQVIPALYGLPEVCTPAEAIRYIPKATLDPKAWTMITSHFFGSCRLHPDPARGAVGRRFEVHGAPGIHVVDASLFPTNTGVNPQHAIMAVALLAARAIAQG